MNPPENDPAIRVVLTLSAGAVCISFAAIFVKMIGEDTMGPTAIAFWRLTFGAAILFGWSVAAGHAVRMPLRAMRWAVLAGFIFFLDLFLWHRSIFYSGAGLATILANTQVFGTAVLSFFIFKEKLSLRFFLAAVSAVAGVALLVGIGSDIEFTSRYVKGVILGLATGLVYATYIVTLKVASQKENRPHFLTFMAWVSLYGAIFTGLVGSIEDQPLIPPDLYTLAVLAALAFVAQSLGWWAIASSLPRIETSRGGLLLLLQPVLATVWGMIFFAERLNWVQVIGAIATLAAMYFGAVRPQVSQSRSGFE